LARLQFLLTNLNVDLVDFALRQTFFSPFAFEFPFQLVNFALNSSLLMGQSVKFLSQSFFFTIANAQSFNCRLDVLLLFCLFLIKNPSLPFILLCTSTSMLFQLLLKLLINTKLLNFELSLFIFLLQLELLSFSFKFDFKLLLDLCFIFCKF